jgi:hypothetical protein
VSFWILANPRPSVRSVLDARHVPGLEDGPSYVRRRTGRRSVSDLNADALNQRRDRYKSLPYEHHRIRRGIPYKAFQTSGSAQLSGSRRYLHKGRGIFGLAYHLSQLFTTPFGRTLVYQYKDRNYRQRSPGEALDKTRSATTSSVAGKRTVWRRDPRQRHKEPPLRPGPRLRARSSRGLENRTCRLESPNPEGLSIVSTRIKGN